MIYELFSKINEWEENIEIYRNVENDYLKDKKTNYWIREIHNFFYEKLNSLVLIKKDIKQNEGYFILKDFANNINYEGIMTKSSLLIKPIDIQSCSLQDDIYFLQMNSEKLKFIGIKDGVLNIDDMSEDKIISNYYDSDATKYILENHKNDLLYFLNLNDSLFISDNILPDVLVSTSISNKFTKIAINFIEEEKIYHPEDENSVCINHFKTIRKSGILNEIKTFSTQKKQEVKKIKVKSKSDE